VYQHAPTPGAPGIYRHRRYLAELVRRGWHVDLVSSPLNYMTGTVPTRYRRRLFMSETIDGVRHHWVWASGGIHASRLRRTANYVTFAASASLRAALLPRPDVLLVSSPPLTVGALGPILGKRASRWVFEVRDVWPESAASVGWLSETSATYRLLHRLARRLATRSAATIVPTPALVDAVRAHGAANVFVIPGSVIESTTAPSARARTRRELEVDDDDCLFVYVGAIGVANGLEVLLDAVERLPADTGAAFVIAGDGSARPSLERRLARKHVPVRLLGAISIDRVPDLLAASDVCLHVLRRDPVFEAALPTKVLEYFGARRPFITTVPGLPEQLARESGGGFAADVETLAAELTRWTHMTADERRRRGEKSFRYGVAKFGLEAAVDELEAALCGHRADHRARQRDSTDS
jgi:hypothetical protein